MGGDASPGPGSDRSERPSARSQADGPDRPPIGEEPAILGLSRLSRGRLGSRLFTWFFVLVFAVILIQLIVVLLNP